MDDPTDLSAEVKLICEKLGLAPEDVGRLDLRPAWLRVTVYLRNDNGAVYLDPNTDQPAQEILTYAIRS